MAVNGRLSRVALFIFCYSSSVGRQVTSSRLYHRMVTVGTSWRPAIAADMITLVTVSVCQQLTVSWRCSTSTRGDVTRSQPSCCRARSQQHRPSSYSSVKTENNHQGSTKRTRVKYQNTWGNHTAQLRGESYIFNLII